MNRVKLLAAVGFAAVTTFGAPSVPAAFAGDNDRREYRDNDRGRDGYRDRSREDDRRYDRDNDRRRGPQYAVVFHLDGGSTRHKAKDRFRAAEIEEELSRLGVSVHIHDKRELHLKFRGEGRAFFRTDEEAHLLARRLENYGFHVVVDHR